MSASFFKSFGVNAFYNPTVALALALMAVIAMMIIPIPAWMLDIGLAASFALAILIFTITLFVQRPLDFSSFPTILLASLMLRLALNVSSTKLIIGEGHNGTDAAGGVIEGFAMFIMGGNIFLGIVIFLVLLIVNFLVITKGAGRMAEVGARFALDGMPGKQLAIDSDMAAGAINHEEARQRRQTEQEETTFFGSLDGDSKFVKGDAVAGLLITLLNLVMGLTMGVAVHGMPLAEAVETYAILTVGDGLVSQIPSVIISVAAGLLLSRGGVLGSADQAIVDQLSAHPAALYTVGGLLAMFALLPGLPFVPFMVGAMALCAVAWVVSDRKRQAEEAEKLKKPEAEAKPVERPIGDILDVDEVHIEFAKDVVPYVLDEATGLERRIKNMRRHLALEFGFVIPEVRLTDDPALTEGYYRILIQGVSAARDRIAAGKVLVLTDPHVPLNAQGDDVAEPVYGAPARWIEEANREEAAMLGLPVISPTEVIATHLLETIQSNFGRLFTRRALQKILDEFVQVSDAGRADANRKLVAEFVPDKVSLDLLQTVMRLLLEERVSIRNLPLIIEAVAEAAPGAAAPEQIADYVRQRIGFQLVSKLLSEEGTLPLVQLSPDWEKVFLQHQVDGDGATTDVALPPEEFSRLANSVRAKLETAQGPSPAIVTTSKRRRFLRTVLSAKGIKNPVLSYEEINVGVKPALVGVA
ncbi:MAG: flagellar biosynthesis protein FlhA [Pseudomonadota bacterium]